jgi:hypothetical protein
MMKKFLVLIMVLGMATMANAGIQISVNGNISGPDEITLTPSDTITLDIWNTAGGPPPPNAPRNFIAYLDILPNNTGCYDLALPRLDIYNAVSNPTGASGDFPSNFIFNQLEGNIDEYTVNQNWAPGTPGEVVGAIFLVDFHCLSPNNVLTIQLYDSRVGDGMVVVDSLTIHQIPEPMTMALLGLGGLFLKRRK